MCLEYKSNIGKIHMLHCTSLDLKINLEKRTSPKHFALRVSNFFRNKNICMDTNNLNFCGTNYVMNFFFDYFFNAFLLEIGDIYI